MLLNPLPRSRGSCRKATEGGDASYSLTRDGLISMALLCSPHPRFAVLPPLTGEEVKTVPPRPGIQQAFHCRLWPQRTPQRSNYQSRGF